MLANEEVVVPLGLVREPATPPSGDEVGPGGVADFHEEFSGVHPVGDGAGGRGVEDFARDAWPGLYRTALLMTGSPHDAEDAVQNALAVVVEHWDRISRGDSPSGYSRRVMATQAYRKARRRRLELDRLLLLRRGERDADEDGSERLAQRELLLTALQQLPPRMRTAVVMRFYAGMPERETAEALGCSTGTVKSQTHKGLARLRVLMGPAWDDDAGTPAGGAR